MDIGCILGSEVIIVALDKFPEQTLNGPLISNYVTDLCVVKYVFLWLPYSVEKILIRYKTKFQFSLHYYFSLTDPVMP